MESSLGHSERSGSRGAEIIAISIVFLILAIISVVIRLIARYKYLNNGGWDDILIAIGLVGFTIHPFCALNLIAF